MDADRTSQVLAPLTRLEVVPKAADPLSDHRPANIECNNLGGWYLEGGGLEVNTAKCNYLALQEPAAVPANRGDEINAQINYFDLTASEPAEAHLALLVGDKVIWERTISIPAPGDVIELLLELPVDVSIGTPIGFHLHNHGQNTWNISPLRVVSSAR